MKLHTLIAVSSAGLLAVTGCSKTEDTKTQPGAQAEQGQAVQPAEPAPAGEEAPAAKPGEAPKEGEGVRVENLKVEPAAPGGDESAAAAAADEERITGPVAVVNGEEIGADAYYEEVDKIRKRSAKIPPERMNRIKENILKRLIEKELIDQAVKKAEVAVPEAEIDTEFEEYKKRFRTEEQFQNYLKHGKVTIESIKSRIREKKELEKLLEKTGKLAVEDAEVEEFYTKNERFYQEREGVKARHILVKLKEDANKEEEDKARARIKEIQAELEKGTPFEEVAKKHSEGPSAPKGGDLGFFGRGQMVKPFEEKAFAMKAGEVSEPIRTRFGFHIIEVLEKRDARKKALDEVRDTIKESLRNKKFFQERRTLLNSLKTEAKIEQKIEIPKAAPRPTRDPHGADGPVMRNPHIRPTRKPVEPTAPTEPTAPAQPTEPAETTR